MALEIPVRAGWRGQLVATMGREGQVYLLAGVRKSTCDACCYGVHFDTVWVSPAGEASRIYWCGSCFDGECLPVDLDEGLRRRWLGLLEQISAQPVPRCWNGARPAIEDLERRGLV